MPSTQTFHTESCKSFILTTSFLDFCSLDLKALHIQKQRLDCIDWTAYRYSKKVAFQFFFEFMHLRLEHHFEHFPNHIVQTLGQKVGNLGTIFHFLNKMSLSRNVNRTFTFPSRNINRTQIEPKTHPKGKILVYHLLFLSLWFFRFLERKIDNCKPRFKKLLFSALGESFVYRITSFHISCLSDHPAGTFTPNMCASLMLIIHSVSFAFCSGQHCVCTTHGIY